MTDIVRRGYDELSYLYRADDDRPPLYMSWLAALNDRLPGPADVLDLGCGCGVPVSASLAAAGHRVTGVDFSLHVDSSEFVPEGAGGHQLFWCSL
jgi:SAM-dependent methyltransferase